MKGVEYSSADIAASFQQAAIDVLVSRTINAADEFGYDQIAIAGGVACNQGLRSALTQVCEEKGYSLYYPSPIFCTDNAAMIGVA